MEAVSVVPEFDSESKSPDIDIYGPIVYFNFHILMRGKEPDVCPHQNELFIPKVAASHEHCPHQIVHIGAMKKAPAVPKYIDITGEYFVQL